MKRYLIGLGIVAVVVAGAVVLAPLIVPLNYDKDQIISEIKTVTGRDLTISGPLTLSLLPTLSVEAHGVAFANPSGSLNPTMVGLDTIDVELHVLPLLRGRLDIARFVLKKPEIDLEIDPSGVPNWVFAHVPAAAVPPPEPAPPAAGSAGGAAAAVGRLSIAKLHIEDGSLSFENRRNHTGELVTGLDLDISLPGASGPLAISGSGIIGKQRYAIDLSGIVNVSPTLARIDAASFKFDSIAGTGALSVDTAGDRPKIAGTLALHRLDLTPYMPKPLPPPTKRGAAGETAEPSGWDDTPIDFSALGRVDADLQLSADEIRVRKFDLGHTELHLKLADAKLHVDVPRVNAYGGHGAGALSIDGAGSRAAIGLTFNLAGVQIQPLLVDTISFDRLSGNAAWSSAITTTGSSERNLIEALAGTGTMRLVNGSLRGFNLVKMLSNPVRDLTQPGGQTSIEHMSGSYRIVDGTASNHDLDVKSGNLAASGAGTIDLPRRSLDYRLEPRLGVAIPIRISGPWDSLHYHMDFDVLPNFAGKPVDAVINGVGTTASRLKSLFRLP
jgi:AsmA protein